MKPYSLFAIGVLFVGVGTANAADTVDMAKLTCGELTSSYVEEIVVTGAWMSGYFNGKKSNSVIDIKKLNDNTKNVVTFCATNPTTTVMDAVAKVAAPQ